MFKVHERRQYSDKHGLWYLNILSRHVGLGISVGTLATIRDWNDKYRPDKPWTISIEACSKEASAYSFFWNKQSYLAPPYVLNAGYRNSHDNRYISPTEQTSPKIRSSHQATPASTIYPGLPSLRLQSKPPKNNTLTTLQIPHHILLRMPSIIIRRTQLHLPPKRSQE